jgi:plasmid stabilization system protein ParE
MRIRWTEPAARDLTHICDYTKERNGPAAARRIALAIYEGISSLTQFPQRGRPGRKRTHASWYFQAFLFWPYTASARTLSKSTVFYMGRSAGRK